MKKRTWAILWFVVVSSGCAVGRKHAYDLATPRVTHQGTTWLAVAAHDQRADVVSGQKTPTFVGLSRGGFGNAFDVNTKSGQPLASDFGTAIQRGLAARGYRVTPVVAAPDMRPADVAQALAKTGAAFGLIATITEWKSDTYNNTALVYDVTIRVLDPQARVLGQAVVKGRDDLGGDFAHPGAYAQEAVPDAFQAKLEELLNAPTIAKALQPEQPSPTPPAPGEATPVPKAAPTPGAAPPQS